MKGFAAVLLVAIVAVSVAAAVRAQGVFETPVNVQAVDGANPGTADWAYLTLAEAPGASCPTAPTVATPSPTATPAPPPPPAPHPTPAGTGDYDADKDGLIEVSNLA